MSCYWKKHWVSKSMYNLPNAPHKYRGFCFTFTCACHTLASWTGGGLKNRVVLCYTPWSSPSCYHLMKTGPCRKPLDFSREGYVSVLVPKCTLSELELPFEPMWSFHVITKGTEKKKRKICIDVGWGRSFSVFKAMQICYKTGNLWGITPVRY